MRRRWNPLAAFLVASLVAHAAMVAVAPPWSSERTHVAPRVLEVVIVEHKAPAVVAPAVPRPQTRDDRIAARAMTPAQTPVPAARPQPPNDATTATVRPQEYRPVTRPDPVAQGAAPTDALSVAQASADARPLPGEPAAHVQRASDPSPAAAAGRASPTPPLHNADYLRNPPPVYPMLARRNGEQGTVTLRVLVARDGMPVRVSVERTSGYAHLDRSALEAVKGWRFVPAREGSESVEAWVLVPIVFRLEGTS